MTLRCLDDFFAVWIGFSNITGRPWRLEPVIDRAFSGFYDYIILAGGAEWVGFSSGHDSDDHYGILQGDGEATLMGVRPCSDDPLALAAGGAWTWTDRAAIRSKPRQEPEGPCTLMLCVPVSSNQLPTF